MKITLGEIILSILTGQTQSAEFYNNIIRNNHPVDGTILSDAAIPNIYNCLIYKNNAVGLKINNMFLAFPNRSISVRNCSIYQNNGGIAMHNWAASSIAEFSNVICYNNNNYQIGDIGQTSYFSKIIVRNSIVEGGESGVITILTTNLVWETNNIDSDPEFSDPVF